MIRISGRTDESQRGSIAVTVIIMMVATALVTTVILAVLSSLNATRATQNRVNAFQFANAGMDQAVYRIDANQLPTQAGAHYTPTVVGGSVVAFTDVVTVGTSTFTITASEDVQGVSGSWTVKSVGTDKSGKKRAVVANVTATSMFTNAFFVLNGFSLTGNQSTPRWFKSSQCATIATNIAGCDLGIPIPARLGTNGTTSGSGVSHFADEWQGFMMYGEATQQAANNACSGCPAAQVAFSTNALAVPVPPVPTGALACPSGGNIATATIQPGDYLCSSLNITGTMTVGNAGNGTGIVRFWIQNTGNGLSVSGIVNKGHATKSVQFFMDRKADGTALSGSICGSEIWALMYTPGLTISCNGSHQPEIYGAVIANSYAGTGNHFGFHWDGDAPSAAYNGKFTIQNWRECPANLSTC